MASLIEKIALETGPTLEGVDWEALEREFGLPREEIVYDTSREPASASGWAKYQAYIQAAYQRANQSLDGVVLSWQIEDDPATSKSEVLAAMRAWESVQKETVTIGDAVLHGLRTNVDFLSSENAFEVDREKLRAMISSTYMVCLFGAVAHARAIMQLSDVAPEDIIDSADNITKTFNALADLADMGVLDPLKREASEPAGTQLTPLGAVPVAVVVAIIAVVAVGIIAWCIVAVMKQIETNRAIRALCADAATGSEEDKERCAELVKLNLTSSQGGPLDNLAKSIGEAALMIGISYAVIMVVVPFLARSLKAKKASTAA